jgi:hypothetical protein
MSDYYGFHSDAFAAAMTYVEMRFPLGSTEGELPPQRTQKIRQATD